MFPLSDRQIDILVCVVELFNETGEPVSSAAVARHQRITVSSATVRNVMAELEERNLLAQPHTSAGRQPTPAGMRSYVDHLVATGQTSSELDEEWRQHLRQFRDDDVDAIVRSAGLVISQISRLTSIVSSPRVSQIRLKDLQLSWISNHRVLVILITEDGRVFNRVVRLDEPLERPALERMHNYLSELVVGHSLRDVRRRVHSELQRAESRYRRTMRRALEIGQEVVELATRSEFFVEGTLHMLDFSEIVHDIERVRDVLRTLEDRERVLEVLDGICETSQVQTLIGSELGAEWGGDLSLIACGYFQEGRQAGLVGILGPMRMNYARIIPLVEHTARMLSKELEELA